MQNPRPTERECIALLGLDANCPASLPFFGSDATTGCENELQVAVGGRREAADLPRAIEQSSYYANIIKRTARGDTSPRLRRNLERYLDDNVEQVWENSWVRFPLSSLHPNAMNILAVDLLANKQNPAGGERSDSARFFVEEGGKRHLRIPISYLLKLALADVLGEGGGHEAGRQGHRGLQWDGEGRVRDLRPEGATQSHQSDVRDRPSGRGLTTGQEEAREPRTGREVRTVHQRLGVRERVLRAERS